MLAQRLAAFIERNRIVERHFAAFELAHDFFERAQRIFEGHAFANSGGSFGHRPAMSGAASTGQASRWLASRARRLAKARAHAQIRLRQITPDVVAAHGLSEEEYERVLHALGREPNLVELGIFSVMWSEHCSYKSSRIHLKKLPTEAPWVICGPGENAGVIDIGDRIRRRSSRWKSHNHPSYIEPYQGAATGVGGILRDVFTMGARPVANLNALRFGRPDHPKMKHLVQGVVAGIGGYGNCVGVPTVGGETNFHKAYDGNILVNAMTVGVADQDKIFYSAATGHRQSDRLCRLQDRARRHPRRDHGQRRFRRGYRSKAPDRAGRRSLHRKAADRGLPRTDGDRRDRRHSGHGRGGADQLQRRNGDQRQGRDHPRHGQGAVPRRRHDAL